MNASAISPPTESRPSERVGLASVTRYLLLVVALWFLCTRFSWIEVWRTILALNVSYVVPVVILLTPLSVVLRSYRWRALMPQGSLIPLRNYIRAYLIGVLANAILVGKLGDIVKARVLCRGNVRMGHSLGSAILDRLIEGALLLIIVAFALATTPGLPPWTMRLAVTSGVLTLLALAVVYASVCQRFRVTALIDRVLSHAPGFVRRTFDGQAARLLDGLSGITQHRRVAVAFGWNCLVWTVEVLAVVAFLKAFAIHVPLLLAALIVLLALNFGTLLPVAPGNIGLYQLLCVVALSIWGVRREVAVSFGVVMQAVLFLPVYVAGAICIFVWRDVDATAASAPVAAQDPVLCTERAAEP